MVFLAYVVFLAEEYVVFLDAAGEVVRFLAAGEVVRFFAATAGAVLDALATDAGALAVFGDTAAAELLPERFAAGEVVRAKDGSTDVAESVNASAAESAARANTGAVSPSARSARTTKGFFAAVRRPYDHETRARAPSSVISSSSQPHIPRASPSVPHTAHYPPTITFVDNVRAIDRPTRWKDTDRATRDTLLAARARRVRARVAFARASITRTATAFAATCALSVVREVDIVNILKRVCVRIVTRAPRGRRRATARRRRARARERGRGRGGGRPRARMVGHMEGLRRGCGLVIDAMG